jgi:Abnormal spindle-like microcephaly-assoc'd, ASPM-SPD-2-Hydin/Beta-propeller repeat
MKPAFVLILAAVFLISVPAGLSPHKAPASPDALASLSLQPKGPSPAGGQNPAQPTSAQVTTLLGSLPLYFVENKGQADNRVRYAAKTRNGTVYFTDEEIVYEFILNGDTGEKLTQPLGRAVEDRPTTRKENIGVRFIGADKRAKPGALGEQEAKYNYFRGNDPQKWISGARSYQGVAYRNLYPGIDLRVSGDQGRMKNEYLLSPGADPSTIRIKYDGAKALKVNKKGQLEIQTSAGMLLEDIPLSYQVVDGKKREVRTAYRIAADQSVQFRVGKYRKDTELVIDPLIYSTLLGGTGNESGQGIAVDGSGNVYVAGYTFSSDFPATSGAYDTSYNGAKEVFVIKLNSSGTGLLFATFLGGSSDDEAKGIGLDGSGNAYVSGYTASTDFPVTSGALDTSYNGGTSDSFIAKLNSSGSTLIYSTYLGGSGWEYEFALFVDASVNAYVTGYTSSSNFPTTSGAYDTSFNGGTSDAFVVKINSSGTTLLYSTYLGGAIGQDAGYGLFVDGSGYAYVVGYTGSTDYPTTVGAYDTTSSTNSDGFVTKLNAAGNALVYSTFLGGSGYDEPRGIVVDGSGNAFIVGFAGSTDFPTTLGAYDTSYNGGSYDPFVTKLNSSGSALLYSTYMGGGGYDGNIGVALDTSGIVYVVGTTQSSDFPTTPDAYDTGFSGASDAFVAALNSWGAALLYSTYLGGAGFDEGHGIALDGSRMAYVTGSTQSSDFPTTAGAHDTTLGGTMDAFITKLVPGSPDIHQPISPISFGSVNVGSSSDQATTIYNDGSLALTVNSISRQSGSTEFLFVGPNTPFSIPAGGSQAVTVRFSPTSGGAKSAVFNVNSDDSDEQNVPFDVSGTGAILTETVSVPVTPAGPASGVVNTSYVFATGNSTSNLGHNVQYYFNWGDGTNSGWLSVGTLSAQKSWSSANTYNVTAKARCATDTAVESSFSSSLAVAISPQGYVNSPSNYQVIPECLWAVASGGGTWVSEVQITDLTGGSVVSVYFDYGAGNRRGPFTLWTSPGVNQNVKYPNILSSIDALDAEAFTYYGRVGAVEFSTQDASHRIQVAARTLNGNYSKTFPGLNLTDSNTSNTSRRMILQNFVNNSTYRSSCGFFNPTTDSVTLELKLIDATGSQIGSTITRTLLGYDFQSFSPFNQAGVPYPANSYDNVVLWITPTSGSGKVMVFGASANNTSNDPAAHIGVQYQ